MQAAKAYKVLVVEDEGLIAHDIATRLEALGHQVVATVATAEEAVERAAGADVVLMDIRIDGQRDGIAAAQEVRARHHVPVVFLTAHADRATLERAKAADPFGYITKALWTEHELKASLLFSRRSCRSTRARRAAKRHETAQPRCPRVLEAHPLVCGPQHQGLS